MTEIQYITIIGTIYIVTTTPKQWNAIIGCCLLIAAAAKGMNWL